MLITERKKVNEEKEVFILPAGYKIVVNNPIAHSYLISKRSTPCSIQCEAPSNRPSRPPCSKSTPRTTAESP